MKLIRATAAVALLAAALSAPTPLGACSQPAPEPFAEVLETRQNFNDSVVGFYEQEHLARFPDFLGFERSASVVTRYWGTAPNLRVAGHGAAWPEVFGSTCGTEARRLGTVSANATRERDLDRTRSGYPTIGVSASEYGGRFSAAEVAELDSAFGPATTVSIGADDYVLAYTIVLWRPLLFLSVIASLSIAIWARVRRIEVKGERRFDGPIAVAGLLGIVAIVIAAGQTYSVVEFMWLLAALLGSLIMATLMRTPWAIFGVLYVLWALVADSGFLGGIRGFDDQRMHAGIAGLIIGSGALAWSRNHWTRWVASFTVVASTAPFAVGVSEFRGYANVTKIAALTVLTTASVTFSVWWLVFRERRLATGASAEPHDQPELADDLRQPVL